MWLIESLAAALASTGSNVVRKLGVTSADSLVLAWLMQLFTVPFALASYFWTSPATQTTPTFWWAALAAGILTSFTVAFMFKAYQISEISLIAPLVTLLPAFLALTSFLMLGQAPGAVGLLGIILITAGAYYVNSHPRQKLLDPLRAIAKNNGARLVIATVLIWSVSTNLDKIATRSTSTQLLVVVLMATMAVALSLVVLTRHRASIKPTIIRHWKIAAVLALLSVAAITAQTLALQTEFVAYVISIKRLDVLLTVIAGALIFHEKQLKRRLLGALVMVAGAVLISMFS